METEKKNKKSHLRWESGAELAGDARRHLAQEKKNNRSPQQLQQ